jgi:hypothetical protein
MPYLWPAGNLPRTREFVVGGYRIIYEIDPDTGDAATAGDVMVLRVFHPGQARIFERE